MNAQYFFSILMLIFVGSGFSSAFTSQSSIIRDDKDVKLDTSSHQVSIIMKEDGIDFFLCSGSIYSERVIITGAYCLHQFFHGVIPLYPKQIFVLAGSHGNLINGTEIAVKSIEIHPNFNGILHDIGMIHLQNKLEFNDHISPIALPEYNESKTSNLPAILTDMVFEKETGRKSAKLVHDEIPEFINCTCPHLHNPEPDTIICAPLLRRSEGLTCSIRSGSSLVVNKTLVGVGIAVSGHKNCYHDHCSRVIFTKVSKHVNWIKDTAEEWSSSKSYGMSVYVTCSIAMLVGLVLAMIGVTFFILFMKRPIFNLTFIERNGLNFNSLILKNEVDEDESTIGE